MSGFVFYNFRTKTASGNIADIFPGWCGEKERVVVLSPHDDDALLGAGYAMKAAMINGGEVYVIIFCDGRAGYSSPEERLTVVSTRMMETTAAYSELNIGEERIIRVGYPDFSAMGHLGWKLINGEEGSFALVIRHLRSIGATRLLLPNGYREHIDHEAVHSIGAYDGPQAGDPILADWGMPASIRTYLDYAVWGDFGPEDALVTRSPDSIRANLGIKAPPEVESEIAKALGKWESQQSIIAGILNARGARRCKAGYLEAYLGFDPRPGLNYRPYVELAEIIDKNNT